MIKLVAVAGRQAVGGVFWVRVALDRQDVVPVENSRCGSIEDEPCEGPPVLTQMDAVQVDIGHRRRALEVKEDLTPPVRLAQGEMGAIPNGFMRLRVSLGVPGVGESDDRPGLVVKARLLDPRPARLAREAPGTVESDLFPRGNRRRGGGL